jgi:soluble lytic murein transglycosylase
LKSEELLPLFCAKAELLVSSAKPREAAQVFAAASNFAFKPKDRERLLLAAAKAARDGKDLLLCEKLATPLAERASTGATMEEARVLLESIGKPPRWSLQQRLERARLLTDRRAFGPAVKELASLTEVKNDAFSLEAKWLLALAQFNRRGHYDKALAALKPFSEGKGPRADEAAFLMARALARLDRDEEAIRAFKALSRKILRKDPVRSAECLYHAGRLEHYLGRYQASWATLGRAIGKSASASRLRAEDRRDALFLAGLSSFLLGKFGSAAPLFQQSVIGTANAEVKSRGLYWEAVALHKAGSEKGIGALEGVCRNDPTSWYGALAAARLLDEGKASGACTPSPLSLAADEPRKPIPLEKLSDVAAFLFEAGFFKEAATALRTAEEQGLAQAGDAEWIYYYNLLDAPKYAIRRAASGLRWPPSSQEVELARAAYPRPFVELVTEVEDLHGLPKDIIYAIARKESLFDPNAVSSVGAMGLMQMMPATYEKNRKRAGLPPLASGQLPTPESSIRSAGYELAELLERLEGQLPLAIMAYNAGPGAVRRWLDRSGDQPLDIFVEQVGFAQTRNYIRRTYQNLARYRLLAGVQPPELPKLASRLGKQEQATNEAEETDVVPLEDESAPLESSSDEDLSR